MTAARPHRFEFFRAGGVDQVRLDRDEDVLHLAELDQKLWVALSCPVRGLEFDERTLELLDSDGDGRVRAPEILGAIAWLKRVLAKPAGLVEGRDGVLLDAIDTRHDEGRRLAASARRLLEVSGCTEGKWTVAEAAQGLALASKAPCNGDGVVPPDTVDDPAAQRVAEEILATVGGVDDRSGSRGYDRARLEAFYAACAAYDAWRRVAEDQERTVLPLGAATERAADVWSAVQAKVDDYFARCRLVAYDARAQNALNREESAYLAFAAKDLSITNDEVRSLPLATIDAGRALPLEGTVNPAWESSLRELREAAVEPLLGKGRTELAAADWERLSAALAPHVAWRDGRAGGAVESLRVERVREILAGPERAALEAAIEADLAQADAVAGFEQLEKLARLMRDLVPLLRNFVSFETFYGRRGATFQVGRLYLDGRSCDLVVGVDDPAKHATLAPMSKAYLTYLDCRRASGATMQIAAAFTDGDGDNLFVGRNGVFYDRRGRDWHATITKIVENPISVRQAFWSPYKKTLRWIEEQVGKRAAAADEAANTRLRESVESSGKIDEASTGASQPKKLDIGVLAAISVAISGVAVVVGSLLQAFFGLGYLMPLGVLGLLLAISAPSMLIAWLKLRQRNLGPLLDANGWAVNALARVNIPLGRSLTGVRRLPPGSKRSFDDPFADRRSPVWTVLVVLIALGLVAYGLRASGHLHRWFPNLPWPPASATVAEEPAVEPAAEPAQDG